MTIRKCENCVSASGRKQQYLDGGDLVLNIRCQPRLPDWLLDEFGFDESYCSIVPNHTAEKCSAFVSKDDNTKV